MGLLTLIVPYLDVLHAPLELILKITPQAVPPVLLVRGLQVALQCAQVVLLVSPRVALKRHLVTVMSALLVILEMEPHVTRVLLVNTQILILQPALAARRVHILLAVLALVQLVPSASSLLSLDRLHAQTAKLATLQPAPGNNSVIRVPLGMWAPLQMD